jgi:dihydroorotate dehydrogenase
MSATIVVKVGTSTPNTPGLRSLQGGEQLGSILATLQQQNDRRQPIFVKIAPDLEWEAIGRDDREE